MTWNDLVNGTLEDSRTRSCATHKWEQGWGWFWSWSLICILIEAYKFHILFLSRNPIEILPPAGSWRAQKPLLLTKPPSPTLPYCQHLREYTHPILRWLFLQEDTELVIKASSDMWGKLWDGKHEYEARQFVCHHWGSLFTQEIVGRCHNRGRIIYTTATCRTTKEGKNHHKNSFQTAPHTRGISFL